MQNPAITEAALLARTSGDVHAVTTALSLLTVSQLKLVSLELGLSPRQGNKKALVRYLTRSAAYKANAAAILAR